MTKRIISDIVEACLRLDEAAVLIYDNLSRNGADRKLKSYWAKLSEEEKRHVSWWKKLAELAGTGALPQLFEDPGTILRELRKKERKVQAFSALSGCELSVTDQFMLAYWLEFYILHSAFGKLWHFVEIMEPDSARPEVEYDAHISDFIAAMTRYGVSRTELDVLGDALAHLWTTMKDANRGSELDGLTKVLNRKSLLDSMLTLAFFAKRNRFTSGMLFMDIDEFKSINDTHGHQAGDRVLTGVARIISATIRKSDVFGRYGGEEFLLFLPQIEPSSIGEFADKIRRRVEDGMRSEHAATISMGVVCRPITGDVDRELHALIKRADELMYRAKSAGRNTVEVEIVPELIP